MSLLDEMRKRKVGTESEENQKVTLGDVLKARRAPVPRVYEDAESVPEIGALKSKLDESRTDVYSPAKNQMSDPFDPNTTLPFQQSKAKAQNDWMPEEYAGNDKALEILRKMTYLQGQQHDGALGDVTNEQHAINAEVDRLKDELQSVRLEDQLKGIRSGTEREQFEKGLSAWNSIADNERITSTKRKLSNGVTESVQYPEYVADDWSPWQMYEYAYLKTNGGDYKEYAKEVNRYNASVAQSDMRQDVSDMATKNFGTGVLATLGSVASGMTGIYDMLENFRHEGTAQYSREITPFQMGQTAQGSIAESLNKKSGTINEDVPIFGGKGLGDAYSAGTSMVQSALSALASTAIGGTVGEAAGLSMFFSSAGASTYYDALERGASNSQALLAGFFGGAAEVLGEKLSLENILHGNTDFLEGESKRKIIGEILKRLNKGALIEGSEEFFTNGMNAFFDNLVMRDKSEYNKLVSEYMASDMGKKEAERAAVSKMLNDAAFEAANGYLTGFIMSGVSQAAESTLNSILPSEEMRDQSTVRRIVEKGLASEDTDFKASAEAVKKRIDAKRKATDAELKALQDEYYKNARNSSYAGKIKSDKESVSALIESGLESDENSEAYKVAKELSEKQESGDDISLEEIEKAVKAIDEEIAAENTADKIESNTGNRDIDLARGINEIVNENGNQQSKAQNNESVYANSEQKAEEANQKTQVESESEKSFENSEENAKEFARSIGINGEIGIDQFTKENLDSAESIDEWSQFYQAGKIGADIETPFWQNAAKNITDAQKQIAYNAGRMDAITETKGAVNGRTESLSQGVQRNQLLDSRKQGTGVERASAQDASWGQGRNQKDEAIRIRNAVKNSEQVSSNYFGVDGGTDAKVNHIVPESAYSADMKNIASSASASGNVVAFVTGNLRLKDGLANGYNNMNGLIVVRADDPNLTPRQIYEHEDFHSKVKNDKAIFDRAIENLTENYTDEQIDEIVNAYADAYGYEIDDAFEEMLADAYAGAVNVALRGKTSVSTADLTESVREAAKGEKQERAPPIQKEIAEAKEAIEKPNKFSLTKADTIEENSLKKAESKQSEAFVNQLKETIKGLQEVKKVMQTYVGKTDIDGNKLLPEETKFSNNIFSNSSYLKDAEPTTECYRQTIYRAFTKLVTDKLGRPLTNKEAIIANQACIEIGVDAPCIYCYSLLDRKAKEAYKIQYVNERDAFLKKVSEDYNGNREAFARDRKNSFDKYYQMYLDRVTDPSAYDENGEFQKSKKRSDNAKKVAEGKETDKMKRVNLWLDIFESGYDPMPISAIRNYEQESVSKELFKNLSDKKLSNLRLREINDALYWAQSSSQAKIIVPYSAYTNEGRNSILSWKKPQIDALNNEYGLRWYSHADYHPAFTLDNMQQIIDASIMGLKGLMYVKPVEAVKIFAPSGMNMNVSCFAQYNKETGDYEMDDRLGANWDEVKELRDKYKNVGAVMVVTSDDELLWAITRDWVDVVIPLHLVRAGDVFVQEFGLQNYSAEQADKLTDKDLYDKFIYDICKAKEEETGKEVSDKEAKSLKKGKKSIYPNEHHNNYGDYISEITKRGMTPRFDRMRQIIERGDASWGGKVATMKDYMKLVNETRQSDRETQPLQPKFDIGEAINALNTLPKKGYLKYFKEDQSVVDGWADRVVDDIKADKDPAKLGYGRDLAIDENGKYIEIQNSHQAARKGVGGIHDGKMSRTLSEETDSDGNRLSESQAEFFKNSKVRDEDGNLIKVYHGTKEEFYEFLRDKIGGNAGSFEGAGFNFTPSETRARGYSNGVLLAGYANVTKPLSFEKKTISRIQLAKLIEKLDPTGDNLISDYAQNTRDYGQKSFVVRESKTTAKAIWDFSENDVDLYSQMSATFGDKDALIEEFKRMGYDGLIHYHDDGKIQTVITFDSNQFKDADNLEPTESADRRFSRTVSDEEYLDLAKDPEKNHNVLAEIVASKASERGFNNAIPEQTLTFTTRKGAAPNKTKTVYKVFTLSKNGRPSALFVSSSVELPVGVWLDANDTFHFTDMGNGHMYVPSTKNPNTKGGATGSPVETKNISRQDLDMLEKLGYISRDENGNYPKTITSLAYRPGWHAGDLPFFPQGGMQISGSNYKNVHRYNQVVFECEIAADNDYTSFSKNEDGNIVFKDRQEMPTDGMYKFATNPMAKATDIGSWYISGSLKIVRALSEAECNAILEENGRSIQEWQQYQDADELSEIKKGIKDKYTDVVGYSKNGKPKYGIVNQEAYKAETKSAEYDYEHSFGNLDLSRLGYDENEIDAARKTLAPVTYDDDGNIIPLSKRFDTMKNDVRYSRTISDEEASALRKENTDLKRKLKEAEKRAEKWKNETKKSELPTVRKDDAHRLALSYMREFNSVDVTDEIEVLANYIVQNSQNLKYDEIDSAVDKIADKILENASEKTYQDVETNNQIRSYLKQKIEIPESAKADIPDFNSWRKQYVGRMSIGTENGGIPLDTAYNEMRDQFPNVFPDVNAGSDRLLAMAKALDDMKVEEYNPFVSGGKINPEIKNYLKEKLVDDILGESIRQQKTVADRYEEKLSLQKARAEMQAAELKEKLNAARKETQLTKIGDRIPVESEVLAFSKKVSEAYGVEVTPEMDEKFIAAVKSVINTPAENLDASAFYDLYPVAQYLLGVDGSYAFTDAATELEKTVYALADQLTNSINNGEISFNKTYADKAKERIEALRKNRDERIAEIKQKYQERIGDIYETRKRREYLNKITKTAKDLNQKISNPTDKKHIPQKMQNAVKAYLAALDFTGGNRSQIAFADQLAKFKEAFDEEVRNGTMVYDPDLSDSFHENETDNSMIGILLEKVKGKSLVNMTSEELADVYEVTKIITDEIKSINKAFKLGRSEFMSDLAKEFMLENSAKNKGNVAIRGFEKASAMATNMLNPVTFFHEYGDIGDQIFAALREARDNDIEILKKSTEKMNEILGDTDILKLRKETVKVTLGGKEIEMPITKLMSLAALWRRAEDIESVKRHIEKGGVVIREEPSKFGKKYDRNPKPITGITQKEIENAILNLGSNADIVVKVMDFLSGDLSKYANEAAMRVYNYEKFTEKKYFPMKVDKRQIDSKEASLDAKSKNTTSVAGMGSAKSLDRKASNALVLDDFFTTTADHIKDMARYAAYLEILEDINRLKNYKFRNEDGAITASVGDAINGAVYQGRTYLDKLLQDIAIGTDGGNTSRLFSNWKAAAVGANLRVALQQPTAIIRAASIIDSKYVLKGIASNYASEWREAKAHSPIALWKSWGFYDINSGKQLESILLDTETAYDKVMNVMSAGAAIGDAVGWGWLWASVKAEVIEQNKGIDTKSDRFFELVKNRFEEIVDRTQVVDGVLQRSGMMREKDGLTKMATSFMGEPMMQMNMIRYAKADIDAKKAGAKKTFGRVVGAITVASIINAAVQSIVDAYRTDDRDKSYWERYFESFFGIKKDEKVTIGSLLGGNVIENLNPLTWIPFIKDGLSLIQGYDVERSDMTLVSNFISAAKKILSSASNGKTSTAMAAIETINAAAAVFGVPVANIKRDLFGLVNTIANDSKNYQMQYAIAKTIYNDKSSYAFSTFADILYDAYKEDPKTAEKIYKDMVKNPNLSTETKTAEERIRDSMNSKIRKEKGASAKSEQGEWFMTDEQKRLYDKIVNEAKSSKAYSMMNSEQMNDLKYKAYQITSESTKEAETMREKVSGGKQYGLTEEEYILYKIALQIADGENNGNKSYDKNEKERALDLVGGLSEKEREYLKK